MGLRDKLSCLPVRERSGGPTAGRFEFQRNWALCKLLELHEGGRDYCLILEHHEDVLVLDSAEAPTTVGFYQVKTREGKNWTQTALLRRERGKDGPKLSILGKLYLNRIRFGDDTASLTFVSNAPFDLPLADESSGSSISRSVLRVADLDEMTKKQIATQLCAEHGLAELLEFAQFVVFEKCALSLADHPTHTRGRLGDFLERIFPERTPPTGPVYQALAGELSRKNSAEAPQGDFTALVAQKALDRATFERMLARLDPGPDLNQLWRDVHLMLIGEQTPFPKVEGLRRGWVRYAVQRGDLANTAVQLFRDDVLHLLGTPDLRGCATLGEFLTKALEACRGRLTAFVAVQGEDYVAAAFLLERMSANER